MVRDVGLIAVLFTLQIVEIVRVAQVVVRAIAEGLIHAAAAAAP
jgi:hypothetical protein